MHRVARQFVELVSDYKIALAAQAAANSRLNALRAFNADTGREEQHVRAAERDLGEIETALNAAKLEAAKRLKNEHESQIIKALENFMARSDSNAPTSVPAPTLAPTSEPVNESFIDHTMHDADIAADIVIGEIATDSSNIE